MKEKRKEDSKSKHKSKSKKREKRRHSSSSSSSSGSESDEWVEKKSSQPPANREDWMSMTGMLKTYTKEDIRPKREVKDKKHIDSYNPATSSRELNPYWKNGGEGLPQTTDMLRQSRQFMKIKDDEDDDYYSRKSSRHRDDDRRNSRDGDRSSQTSDRHQKSRQFMKIKDDDEDDYYSKSRHHRDGNSSRNSRVKDYHSNYSRESSSWKKRDEKVEVRHSRQSPERSPEVVVEVKEQVRPKETTDKTEESKYLTDEKMNKLAAKIVKAEIMGDTKTVADLKAKLEAAREFRKQNPGYGQEENEAIMLMSTNSQGNSRPLTSAKGDPKSKSGKRKAETHVSGERAKYFGNDDKYSLAQMFQNEKYGNNYDDEAELARIASKHKNPNDDLEDIFMDEISKQRNEAKDAETEKQRAINQHVKMERSIEGCEYCLESKNMLKHLMVSCGNKVYLALPSRKSLVKDHCLISTIQHATCVTSLDEDVWEEILDYRKALTQFFNSQNMDVVFYETATRLHKHPHLVINCVPMPRDVGDTAPIYFKKALLECEAEWSMNKKVVELKGKNIRRGVPKGLPYFWIDFGMDPGFAHVIEDQQLFPKTFADEIIAGILDLDHSHWKNPRKEYGDVQRKKVVEFLSEWKAFDPVKKK